MITIENKHLFTFYIPTQISKQFRYYNFEDWIKLQDIKLEDITADWADKFMQEIEFWGIENKFLKDDDKDTINENTNFVNIVKTKCSFSNSMTHADTHAV